MVRQLILALGLLAVAAVPVPALARDGGHGSHGGHRSQDSSETFPGTLGLGLALSTFW